jgi:hypothetical protein
MQKDLDITSPEGLKEAVADVKLHGDPNFWICISKASSYAKRWMHSTKVALVRGQGLLIQTSTELGDITEKSSSQALTFVPNVYLEGRTVDFEPIFEIRSSTDGSYPPGSFFMNGIRQLPPGSEGAPRGS